MRFQVLEGKPERGARSRYGNIFALVAMSVGFVAFSSPQGYAQCTSDTQCNDNIACTTDICFGQPGTCINVDNCDNGLLCDGQEVCCQTAGGCGAVPQGSCQPGDPFTCDPGEFCSEAAQGCVECETNSQCDDGFSCTTDVCDPVLGCQHTFNTGNSCNDGDACTTNDRCQVVGGQEVCAGDPVDCTAQAPPCHFGVCSQGTGQCQFFQRSDGTSCTPEPVDHCFPSYECESGECVGVPAGGCVDLELRFPGGQTTYSVGDIIEVQLWAKANGCPATPPESGCPTGTMPISGLEGVFSYDETVLEMGDPAETGEPNPDDPCNAPFPCAGSPPSDCNLSCIRCGTSNQYNWGSSVFPNDCDPGAQINFPCTGFPDSDGDFYYACLKQLSCNGNPALPACVSTSGLWVTSFKLKAIAPTAGLSSGAPIAIESCITTAAGQKRTTVVGATVSGEDVTGALQSPRTVEIECTSGDQCPFGVCLNGACAACPPPTAIVEGSRYIGVIPAAGSPDCAIYIEGSSPDVACHGGYVQADGKLGVNPVYRAPGAGGWGESVVIGSATFGAIHARGLEILGGQTYNVYADCDSANPGASLSPAVPVTLWRYGDTNANDAIGVDDVVRVIRGFSSLWYVSTCTSDADCTDVRPYRTCDTDVGQCLQIRLENVDLTGDQTCMPNRSISLRDVVVTLAAFRNDPDDCLVNPEHGVICP